MTDFKRIPPEQAQALREHGAVVVDIRDPQAYAAGHIKDATHLDNHSLHDFIAKADLDAPLIVACYHGNSSQSAAAYLVGQGFSDVYIASTVVSSCGGRLIRAKSPKARRNNFLKHAKPTYSVGWRPA